MKDPQAFKNRDKVKIDVLFVNPGNLTAVYQSLSSRYSAIETPVLAAYFATAVRNHGFSTDLVDIPPFDWSPEEAAEFITRNYQPALLVVAVYGFQPSASTQNMPSARVLCSEIKHRSPNTVILMTGTHPAALPERTLREEPVDYVCDGEGPQTILALADYLVHGKGSLETIPNLWFRDENQVIQNTFAAPLIKDLDQMMAQPAYDLLPMERYRAHNWHCFDYIEDRQPYASLYTSLGCPFKCAFCCINAPFGKPSYRMWSPESVVRSIDLLVKDYGVRTIKFVDEMFVLNRRHVEGICDLLIERDYDLNIWAYARVDTVDEPLLRKMRKAGFRWLALGIESGSKHVRDGVEKGRFGATEIIKVVRLIQECGIYVIGNYIFGLPDDTMETMQETLDLALEANCEFVNFYSAMAYPGSRLYKQALDNGWALPENWIGFSQHSFEALPLPTEQLSAAEVLKFRDDAFHAYFAHPRFLGMIEKKFGSHVVKHLQEMVAIRLPRKIYTLNTVE